MYKLHRSLTTGEINSVQRYIGNTLYSIPFDPANTDYQAYLKWLEEGNQPLPAEE
jgi:glycine betaine/choline ABC-type transport system substrate-binding protein